jgi:hypothetical protein
MPSKHSNELTPVPLPSGKHKAPKRSTIFPVAFPHLPDSEFPITSQEDLVTKLSNAFLSDTVQNSALCPPTNNAVLPEPRRPPRVEQ